MSISLSATDFGTLDQAIGGAQRIKQQVAALAAETASGYLSNDYAGLGQGAATALDLSAEIAGNGALAANADSATNIQSVAQTALGQIEGIASNFASQATTLETLPGTASVVATGANNALRQVAQLLNTKVGDIYVFGGTNSRTPPVPDPNNITSSAFYTAIQTAMAGLTTNGAAATSASALAIASPGGTSPFAPSLEAGGVQSQADLGGGTRVALAPLANANSDAVSGGAGVSSTGSYMRDLMLGLATLGSLGTANTSDPNFLPLVQSTVATLQGSVSAANTDIGALGVRQAQVIATQSELGDTALALKTQLGNIQDADLAQIAAQLTAAQTQLQASYQVISSLSQLSLSKYI